MFFWLVWSGMFDPFHIGLGVISVAIVAVWSGGLLIQESVPIFERIKQWLRFEQYAIWLIGQIILANIDVFKLAFHPNVRGIIQPQRVTFKTTLKGDIPQFILAQSITLTPGTVTSQIEDQTFAVHAITDDAAKGVPGQMQEKVAHIFRKSQS